MASTNVSFHIAVGSFRSAVYPGDTEELPSAARDAREMYNIATDLGYTGLDRKPRKPWDGSAPRPPEVLLDRAASYRAVVDLFESAAKAASAAGDRCFITFSSHGTQLKNVEEGVNFDGRFDEAVCLDDYPLRDDVLHGLLSKFEPGVNVTVVLDCCHSGANSTREGTVVEHLKDHLLEASFSPVERTPLSAMVKRSRFGIVKASEEPVTGAPPLAVELQIKFRDFGQPQLRANVAVFQACGANEKTFGGANAAQLSIYTGKFSDAIKSATTLGELLTAIAAAKPDIPDCTPRFRRTPGVDLTLPLRVTP
jgi:hypothetical protein